MNDIKTSVVELVQRQPWAILPETLDTIHEILYARYFGEGIDIAKVEEKLGRKLDNNYHQTRVINDVAVIDIHGIIAKRLNLLTMISGGVSTELLKGDIKAALDNPDIKAIILDVDSPGGTVDGTKLIADYIYESRGKKPILTYANGLTASAALWIASATSAITSYNTANIGSIGVVAQHYDYSKKYENAGITKTLIYAGKYKTVGDDSKPLSSEDKDYIQGMVDELYTIFVNDIARNRGTSPSIVLKEWADGRLFLAHQAIGNGLIDGIMTLEETIDVALEMAGQRHLDKEYSEAVPMNQGDIA